MHANGFINNRRSTTRILRGYFLLAALQGGFILLTLLQIPTDAKNRFLFGFSAIRLGIVAGVLVVMLVIAWLALETWRLSPWFTRLFSGIERQLKRQKIWAAVVIAIIAGVLGGSYLLLLAPEVTEPFARAYFERLSPLILWATLLSVQTLIVLPALRHGVDWRHYIPQSRTYRIALAIFGLLLVIWGWIAWSRIGLEPDTTGWNALGTPVLETQLLLAWGSSLAFLAATIWLGRRSSANSPDEPRRSSPGANFDLLICLLLWVGAGIYWWSIPFPDSWFVTEPAAPNFEFYPNSDALIYDTTGQSVLVGERFKSWDLPFPRRPMYALMLAVLNVMGSQRYEAVVIGQIVLLALFPVVLYLTGRNLSNRFAGFMVAVLAILREGNAIKLSGNLTISHSKLLMSDFPAALGVALITYLTVTWLQEPESRRTLPVISGGVLGAFMLVRPEIAVLLFVVFIIMSMRWHRRPIDLTKNVLLISAGIILVLSPWIWRNWELTGQFFLDSPNHRIDLFIERFNMPTNDSQSRDQSDPGGFGLPGATSDTYVESSVMAASIPLTGDDFLPENKIAAATIGDILAFVRAHYVHSQIQSVLYLPASWRLADTLVSFLGHQSLPKFFEECCSSKNYVRRLPYWNQNWEGNFLGQSVIPVLLTLFLISVGLRIAWENHRLVGLLPLGFSIVYILINAVARTSGGRYILAVDWIPMLYFAIGLGHITLAGIRFLTAGRFTTACNPRLKESIRSPLNKKSPNMAFPYLAISTGFILLGSLLPLAEIAIPQKYTEPVQREALGSLLAVPALGGLDQSDVDSFLAADGKIVIGRALYPRFYSPGEGAPGKPTTDQWAESAKPSFYSKNFPRLSFYVVGPENMSVLLPLEEPPDDFPNASNVIVLGCQGEEYFDAWVTGIFDAQNNVEATFTRSPEVEVLSCPFPELE